MRSNFLIIKVSLFDYQGYQTIILINIRILNSERRNQYIDDFTTNIVF